MSDKYSDGFFSDDDVDDVKNNEMEGFHVEQTGVDFETFDDLFDFLYTEEKENASSR